MKKMILALALVIGLTTFAQEKRQGLEEKNALTPEQRVEMRVKKLKSDLNLTDKQTVDLTNTLASQLVKSEAKRKEIQTKRKQRKLTKEELTQLRTEMLDEKVAYKSEMKKILTAEQYAKWEQNIDDKKQNASKR